MKLICFRERLLLVLVCLATLVAPSFAQAQGSENSLAKKYFLQGKEHFEAGKFEKALEAFRLSLYEDPTDPVLNHLMGKAAYELGNFEEALFAFERVLVLNPNLALTRLEKAKTHLALGSNLEAKEEFQRVLEADVPPEVRENVEALLAQIGAERKHTFSGVLLLSNLWDSNATLGTGPLALPQAPSLISDPTQRSDRVFSSAVVLSHSYPLAKEGLVLKNSLTGFLSDNTTINENDLLLSVISSGLEYSYKRHLFAVNASWTGILLNEEPYQTNPGLSCKYNYDYSPRVSMSTGASYTRRHHFATGDTSTEQTFGFVSAYNFGLGFVQSDKLNWNFAWTHKFDKTPRDGKIASGYNRYELVARMSRVLTDRISLNLAGTRRHDEYTVTHDVYTDRQRSDLARIASGGFTVKITPKVLFDITGTYTDNNSNIPNNTYIVKQLSMTLTALFGG